MINNAAIVSEIFREAGEAFNKFAEMTRNLPYTQEEPGGKWGHTEMDMMHGCVCRFAKELNNLSQHIKKRTVSQIRTTLKKKAFEDAGIPVRQVSSTVTSQTQQGPHVVSSPLSVINTQTVLGKKAEVTLNMLNASENEVDGDGLSVDVKLEFDAVNEDAAT